MVLRHMNGRIDGLAVSGMIAKAAYEALLDDKEGRLRGKCLIFDDPIKVLASGAPDEISAWLVRLRGMGAQPEVLRQIDLKMITVNPFYPKYRFSTRDYEAAYVDKEALMAAVSSQVEVPVVNVLDARAGEVHSMALR